MNAFDHFARSIHHVARQELADAQRSAQAAHEAEPDELLYADAARYLQRAQEVERPHSLYAEPDAFSAFIGSGSNLPLYDAARTLVRGHLEKIAPESVLDIGTGEGTVVVPVVREMVPSPELTLCDPSTALLDRAVEFAWDCGLHPIAYPYPIEDLLDHTDSQWECALATWSLHNLAPAPRQALFQTLAGRVEHLLIAEFDDPSGQWDDLLAPPRIQHIHDRYREGVREYAGDAGRRVRHGFLLPTMYGYFAPDARRSTFEQPIARWEESLHEAGFAIESRERIYPYWWADAYLLHARRE